MKEWMSRPLVTSSLWETARCLNFHKNTCPFPFICFPGIWLLCLHCLCRALTMPCSFPSSCPLSLGTADEWKLPENSWPGSCLPLLLWCSDSRPRSPPLLAWNLGLASLYPHFLLTHRSQILRAPMSIMPPRPSASFPHQSWASRRSWAPAVTRTPSLPGGCWLFLLQLNQ